MILKKITPESCVYMWFWKNSVSVKWSWKESTSYLLYSLQHRLRFWFSKRVKLFKAKLSFGFTPGCHTPKVLLVSSVLWCLETRVLFMLKCVVCQMCITDEGTPSVDSWCSEKTERERGRDWNRECNEQEICILWERERQKEWQLCHTSLLSWHASPLYSGHPWCDVFSSVQIHRQEVFQLEK